MLDERIWLGLISAMFSFPIVGYAYRLSEEATGHDVFHSRMTSARGCICDYGTVSYRIGPETVTADDVQHIAKITQSEYDALSPPDAATLYVIVG
jgi:hypothetical protein